MEEREYRVKVQVPSQHWNCDDGASATLLVDPDNLKNVRSEKQLELIGALSARIEEAKDIGRQTMALDAIAASGGDDAMTTVERKAR